MSVASSHLHLSSYFLRHLSANFNLLFNDNTYKWSCYTAHNNNNDYLHCSLVDALLYSYIHVPAPALQA